MKKRAEECIPSIKERIKQCLQLGKVVQMQTFECYDVNSQGGCDEGERLVVIRESECGATKCVKNIADGRPCSDELLAYNRGCENSGSKSACKDKGQSTHFAWQMLVIGADSIIKYVTYYLTDLIMMATNLHQLN